MKVVIVGNGPSVLDSLKGEMIDSFDIIVRFNNFKIKGFEKHVGSKTNYWFNTISNHKPEDYSNISKLIWHSWHWDEKTDVKYKEVKSLHSFKIFDISKTNKSIIEEIQEYTGNKLYFNYSTGAIAIWMLLKEHNEVYITGFDWWNKNVKHHYHNNSQRGNIHKPDEEYKFISKLIKENKLKFL